MDNSTHADQESFKSDAGFSLALFTMCIVFSVGLVGNLVILTTFSLSKKLRTPQNMFIISLAVADLLVISQCPLSIMTKWRGYRIIGDSVCLFSACLRGFSFCASIFSIMMVALGRYVSIVKPSLKDTLFTWRRCAFIELCIVIYSLISVSPSWTNWLKVYYFEKIHVCILSSGQNTLYDTLLIVFAVTIPCIVVLYAYLQIYRTFKKSKNSVKVHETTTQNNTNISSSKQRQEIRLAAQLFMIFCIFLASWGTFPLLLFSGGKNHSQPQALYEFSQQIIIANSTVNAPIYLYFNHLFRAEVLRLTRLRKAVHVQSQEASTRTTLQGNE